MSDRERAGLTRRQILGAGAALAAVAALPGKRTLAAPLPALLASPPLAGAPKTKRVVLVVFGGGVRSRETIQSGNVPNLMRLAGEGVLYPSTHVENVGHYGAAASILTGVTENFGIRENDRTPHATVFEMVRKGAGLPAADCWLSTSGSDQETNYAYGSDSRYGSRYGANLIGGEGLFNAEFRELLGGERALGNSTGRQDELLRRLRGSLHPPLAAEGAGGVGNDPEAAARIESYVLEELRGGTSAITGLGASDAKAMRVARNLMGIFRPRLLAVTLRGADVAHGSFNDYVQIIRRNDEELGRLADAIRGDPELRESTALFVLPEFGRDRDLNLRRGLDHGDDSDELHKVALLAWGPDFRKGNVSSSEVRSLDVAPTIASMFGVSPASARGSVLPDLFA
jgi:hypothetical protein